MTADDFHGELVPPDVTQRELLDEANLRAFRAGYGVTRDGRRPPRRICGVVNFGKPKLNIWPRDKFGNLID